jgi:hypothetical protein
MGIVQQEQRDRQGLDTWGQLSLVFLGFLETGIGSNNQHRKTRGVNPPQTEV